MRKIIIAAAALGFFPVAALAEAPSEEQMTRIDEVLKAKSCEVDPANVEVEDGMFDLDDVMCADGQYDLMLDANYVVTKEKKE